MKMGIDSHVQINKGLLDNFSKKHEVKNNGHVNKNKMTWVLNVKTKSIELKSPKKVGTVFGYYNDSIEESLSLIEGEFGVFISKLKGWIKNKKEFNLVEYEIILKEFTMLQYLRSFNFHKKIMN